MILPTKDQVLASLQRDSLKRFIIRAWREVEPNTQYVPGWHIDAITEHLEAVTAGKIRDLVINVPPGHMKSLVCNVFWPAWMWIKKPALRMAFASYTASLTWRDSRKFRALIVSDWYQQSFPVVTLEKDSESLITNSATGFRQCMSVGGDTTGNRSDGFVIDDPLNVTESQSEAAIESCLWWWDQGMANRLNDLQTGWRIIIMQRLHELDLAGHVLAAGGWEHLCLPSEFEPSRRCVTSLGWKDPRTEEKELLFPARFPAEVLASEKLRLGSYGFSGQHQQSPTPSGGGKFQKDWFRYFDRDGEALILHTPTGDRKIWMAECLIFQTADLAMSLKETADYTVCGTWAKTRANELLLLDIDRFRKEAPEVKAALKQSREKWRPTFQGIERAHYGVEVCQQWLRDGIPLKELIADKDKVTRSIPAQLLCENGRLYFLARAPWLADLETELTTFPVGAHDDQVDVVSYAAQIVGDGSYSPPPLPKSKPFTGRPDPNAQMVIQ